MARARTIQHPGFEFYETEAFSVQPYVQSSEALVVGFFSQGPIMRPTAVKDMDEFVAEFGEPESVAEYYSYRGVKAVVDVGRTVTVVRLPYDNSMARLHNKNDSARKSTFTKSYKCLLGNFEIVGKSTLAYQDIRMAYENPVTFKSISFKPYVKNEDEILTYKGGLPEDGPDFVIINKFDNTVRSDGSEIFVSVLGTGNCIRYQHLSNNDATDDVVYFRDGSLYKEDPKKLTFGRYRSFWQSNGDLTENGEKMTVVDDIYDNLLEYFPTISTFEMETKELEVGYPKRTISFKSKTRFFFESGELVIGKNKNLKDLDPENEPCIAEISYGLTSANGTNVHEDMEDHPEKYPTTIDLDGGILEVSELPDYELSTAYTSEQELAYAQNTKYLLKYFDEEKPERLLRQYEVRLSESYDTNYPYLWSIIIDAQYDRPVGYDYYVDKDKDTKISVIVSKIKPSTLEAGTYVTEVVEAFAGSIFKGSLDPITKESNYIGDIINNSSKFIEFYGRKSYDWYDQTSDVILVEDVVPYRLSLIQDGNYDEESDTKFNLNKIIKRAEVAESLDYTQVLEEALRLVRNSIAYTYRDIYDCGLTSIISYAIPDLNGDLYYEPTSMIASETVSADFLNTYLWKKLVKTFCNHCQKQHRLSMFHADGPRKLVLNGNLSRVDDLRQDPMNVVMTNRKVMSVSIKDNTYAEVNVQWWEVLNEFTKTKMWIPNSIKLAGNITYSDIINNIWDAPAGHRYGQVAGVYRPAFNPDYDLADRLYINCLNYGQTWTDGYVTIEGQKTCYYEQSALNRINVRRLMIYLERFVQYVALQYRYQPNNPATRVSLLNNLESEFSRIKIKGGLYDYRIVCDKSNNSDRSIDEGELRITVMVQPVRTVEFIVANFVITKTGQNLEEIATY